MSEFSAKSENLFRAGAQVLISKLCKSLRYLTTTSTRLRLAAVRGRGSQLVSARARLAGLLIITERARLAGQL